jgi:hypothetical protein
MEIKVPLQIGSIIPIRKWKYKSLYKLEELFQLDNENKSSFKNWKKSPLGIWKKNVF